MKPSILIFLFLLSVATKGYGQNEVQANKVDTLKINTFSTAIDLMFNLTHRQMNQYPDLKFINTAQVQYVCKETEFGLYFRQILDRLDNGYLYSNHYLNFAAGIFKYKSLGEKGAFLRFLRPEPVFIFQNNSGRGLSRRFQTGLFLYPVRHFRPNLAINFGIGCLRDWSSWEVNDSDKIEAAPAALKAMILFVNSHSKLRKDRYMDFSEWRPTLYLYLTYNMSNIFYLSLMSSYQQSVVSPFSKEIQAAYPELKKVYPYTYTNLALAAKVYKGLAVKTSFILDYENNNLSIYDSSWEYSIIFGVTWSFAGNKYLPVTYKAKHKTKY